MLKILGDVDDVYYIRLFHIYLQFPFYKFIDFIWLPGGKEGFQDIHKKDNIIFECLLIANKNVSFFVDS